MHRARGALLSAAQSTHAAPQSVETELQLARSALAPRSHHVVASRSRVHRRALEERESDCEFSKINVIYVERGWHVRLLGPDVAAAVARVTLVP